MRAIAGLWRWRHNPLRRTTDLTEAWMALAAAFLIAVAAPLVGAVMGKLSDDALQRSVAQQHRERHQTQATVVRTLQRPPAGPASETVSARHVHSRVLARWQAPDGGTRHGTVAAGMRPPHPGDRLSVWTDSRGTLVAPPLDPLAAHTYAGLAGLGATAVFAGLVECGRRLVLWRMVRRRYARWDQAWDRAGPDWGRTGTGS